jgi:hypothetical protein
MDDLEVTHLPRTQRERLTDAGSLHQGRIRKRGSRASDVSELHFDAVHRRSGTRVADSNPPATSNAHIDWEDVIDFRSSAVGNASSPKGWRYRSTDLSSPVRSVLVEADKIVVKAGAASFGYTVDEPMQGSVGVRLLLGQIAWCATAPAKATGNPPSTARNDTVDRFVAEPKTPPPSSCPPLPQ